MRLPASLPLALLLAGGVAFAQAQWSRIVVQPGKFSVEMPPSQRYEQRYEQKPMQAAGGGRYTMHQYVVERGGRAFVVQGATYPWSVDVSNPRVNLQAGLDSAARELDGSAWAEVKWLDLQGLVAFDAVGRKGDVVFRSYSAMSGSDFVTLTYAGPVGTERAPEVERFVSSLKLGR
jgi:hypothetical protein